MGHIVNKYRWSPDAKRIGEVGEVGEVGDHHDHHDHHDHVS